MIHLSSDVLLPELFDAWTIPPRPIVRVLEIAIRLHVSGLTVEAKRSAGRV
jgi:hypothetical protein